MPDVYDNREKGFAVLTKYFRNAASVRLRMQYDYRNSCFSVACLNFAASDSDRLRQIMKVKDVKVYKSPPNGPDWNTTLYKKLVHFFFLHGTENSSILCGGTRTNGVDALYPHIACEHLSNGMLALLRSCCGVQLFAPYSEAQNRLPLANSYLMNGTAALCGSTVSTYGSSERNKADIINDNYFNYMMAGSPSGAAFLKARNAAFALMGAEPTARDLKIIGEWVLYGQPSLSLIEHGLVTMSENVSAVNEPSGQIIVKIPQPAHELTTPDLF